MHNGWMGPKVKPAQPRALPHGKKDGPRRTPKNVALLLVSSKLKSPFWIVFQVFKFSVNSKEFLANGPYAWAIHHKVIGY